MSARTDLADSVREDDRRKREEAKIQGLQAQIDELRQITRELLSRQLREEEQIKATETALAQHRLALEQHRHEVAQAAQARQVEEARFRQQLTDLNQRIDDVARPIRSLQAHVSELLETVRRQREDVGHDTKRFDELRALIDHLSAHGERQVAVSQGLRDSVDALRTEVERLQRDLMRTDDAVRIVEQELRRRVAEIVQEVSNLEARIAEEAAGVAAVQAQLQELREAMKEIDPQFEAIGNILERLESEIDRFHTQAVERDELMAERIEELRQQFDAQLRDIQERHDMRFERAVQRADQMEEVDRDLAYRMQMIEIRLEELHQVDRRLRRELWYLHEQRARLRFEQAQQELEAVVEARRDIEREDAGGRPQDRTGE
ncbi:hypothetical protein [Sphaerobacter thermophilus]|jgi:chromosome segregation ATPase|uniref:Chromosome segregation ATPase-like protein n=1 Tax=Sphaerobacter thermophilus (strain ATCC 49802 / DSM 20745 / KCCM 41009 / NCIMB 13125 / S 6022) TaxID=479434 RepID=D1C291_SPHTD|nr:hypothetical protein [Sphaerobacter thermophilus]ACZ38358.1 hypothetical protein Sthe_0921 [Sphaerobacter thermophilus DSM 20745]